MELSLIFIILLIVIIVVIVYIIVQLNGLKVKVKEMEFYIEDYLEFQHEITILGSNPKDLIEYFRLKNKHNWEKVTVMVMAKEREDQIDKNALSERQRFEIDELISKERPYPDDILFPIKE